MDKEKPQLIDLTPHVDDRGTLVELWRSSWDCMPQLNQVYLVRNRTPNTVRAFHKHNELWDGFSIVFGTAIFHVWKGHEVQAQRWAVDEHFSYVLDYRVPELLVIPPDWFHGWGSLEDDTILASLANNEYNADNPDEVRIGLDQVSGYRFNWKPVAR